MDCQSGANDADKQDDNAPATTKVSLSSSQMGRYTIMVNETLLRMLRLVIALEKTKEGVEIINLGVPSLVIIILDLLPL